MGRISPPSAHRPPALGQPDCFPRACLMGWLVGHSRHPHMRATTLASSVAWAPFARFFFLCWVPRRLYSKSPNNSTQIRRERQQTQPWMPPATGSFRDPHAPCCSPVTACMWVSAPCSSFPLFTAAASWVVGVQRDLRYRSLRIPRPVNKYQAPLSIPLLGPSHA